MIYKKDRKKTFRKFCSDCGELFSPSGKYARMCDECKKKPCHRPGVKDV